MNKVFEPVFPDAARGKATFSPAVRVGDFLILSGTTATDESRRLVAEGDIVGQARYIGIGFDAIVETVDYVTTFEGYERTAAVRKEVFGDGPYPAATGVMVSGLVRPGALIEIRATAYLGKKS
jgi:aminoacrylate peracid reductase